MWRRAGSGSGDRRIEAFGRTTRCARNLAGLRRSCTAATGFPDPDHGLPCASLSFNANGIRSAASKGFFDWFAAQDTDVLCVQETKAQEHQLQGPTASIRRSCRRGYRACFRDASTRKGYSGVAIYSRREPDEVRTALGRPPFDEEGRYIEARFGKLSVVSFYIPSGSSGELRQGFKFEVLPEKEPIRMQWWK